MYARTDVLSTQFQNRRWFNAAAKCIGAYASSGSLEVISNVVNPADKLLLDVIQVWCSPRLACYTLAFGDESVD
jgi:hypothetical protein